MPGHLCMMLWFPQHCQDWSAKCSSQWKTNLHITVCQQSLGNPGCLLQNELQASLCWLKWFYLTQKHFPATCRRKTRLSADGWGCLVAALYHHICISSTHQLKPVIILTSETFLLWIIFTRSWNWFIHKFSIWRTKTKPPKFSRVPAALYLRNDC